jgi:hypothetical protein
MASSCVPFLGITKGERLYNDLCFENVILVFIFLVTPLSARRLQNFAHLLRSLANFVQKPRQSTSTAARSREKSVCRNLQSEW